MPLFKTSTEWYEQSSLLLQARPTTARITSKYTVLKPIPSKIAKREKYAAKRETKSNTAPNTGSPPPTSSNLQDPSEPSVTFTLKTFDPVSGVCLQYQTTKAAEVGRLVGSLGRLGRHMAALPEAMEDVTTSVDKPGEAVSTPIVEKDKPLGGAAPEAKAAGGGGKKKKKGKK
ncbi:signal recognition particle 9 kDa protein-domain-containing protein [Clohesyomyces aquaticus]|uniref:Signal recognition particle 9 kDa protein-domain-containing protein n=1 Tax=Clohesyomyces aquaticus TaxID=1231657 RepID=A0A1Y1ZFF1_9PLEO|nr:signal recognition particle 9 kDa protein-domain-containing protein [Clohesyomyces aquaticus]